MGLSTDIYNAPNAVSGPAWMTFTGSSQADAPMNPILVHSSGGECPKGTNDKCRLFYLPGKGAPIKLGGSYTLPGFIKLTANTSLITSELSNYAPVRVIAQVETHSALTELPFSFERFSVNHIVSQKLEPKINVSLSWFVPLQPALVLQVDEVLTQPAHDKLRTRGTFGEFFSAILFSCCLHLPNAYFCAVFQHPSAPSIQLGRPFWQNDIFLNLDGTVQIPAGCGGLPVSQEDINSEIQLMFLGDSGTIVFIPIDVVISTRQGGPIRLVESFAWDYSRQQVNTTQLFSSAASPGDLAVTGNNKRYRLADP